MSDVVITVKLLLERDTRRQTRQTKTQMWHTSTYTHTQTIRLPQHTQTSSKLLWITAFLCGLRRWSKKSSTTDLKLISCDRDNLTRSVWHSQCYRTDTKSRARRCSPFKTVCFHMVTVPGWQGFQCVTWALPKHTYARPYLQPPQAMDSSAWRAAFSKHSCVAELRDEAWLCAGPGPVD